MGYGRLPCDEPQWTTPVVLPFIDERLPGKSMLFTGGLDVE